MREYSSFRTAVRSFVAPYKYCRMEKAVLGITGDNMDLAEKQLKGCLIRKGIFRSDFQGADTLAIEGMSMRILPKKSFTSRQLTDNGVRDSFSFGPTLVENGKIDDDMKYTRVDHPNPRCGIGMVEPGHWVAIVTDGRQNGYSLSIYLKDFAKMFIDEGCTVAFNMDGGASAAMVFMGEALNQHFSPSTNDPQRPWSDSILFGYSEQIPSEREHTVHTGYHYDNQ